ncbi:hypothetical protein TNCV_576691 [Trichonephila clavipes]|nr:hypothetical protein TNCV_576691 [Trichonephila clavipes]
MQSRCQSSRTDVTFHHPLSIFSSCSGCSLVHCFQTRITVELLRYTEVPIARLENPSSRRPIILRRSNSGHLIKVDRKKKGVKGKDKKTGFCSASILSSSMARQPRVDIGLPKNSIPGGSVFGLAYPVSDINSFQIFV